MFVSALLWPFYKVLSFQFALVFLKSLVTSSQLQLFVLLELICHL